MFPSQVRVGHRGPQIRMAHGFLHMHRILLCRQPGRHPPMPKIVLNEVRGQLGPLGSGFERIVQRDDTPTRFVMATRYDMVEHPWGLRSTVGGESVSGEVLPHRLAKAG